MAKGLCDGLLLQCRTSSSAGSLGRHISQTVAPLALIKRQRNVSHSQPTYLIGHISQRTCHDHHSSSRVPVARHQNITARARTPATKPVQTSRLLERHNRMLARRIPYYNISRRERDYCFGYIAKASVCSLGAGFVKTRAPSMDGLVVVVAAIRGMYVARSKIHSFINSFTSMYLYFIQRPFKTVK